MKSDGDHNGLARVYLERLRKTDPSPAVLASIDQQLHALNDQETGDTT